MHVALYQPEIPQNAGNIARSCAAVGATLHLIRPLGFVFGESHMKRAGLDYWDGVEVVLHNSWEAFLQANTGRIVCFSSKAQQVYSNFAYQHNDVLLFGPESRGLPANVLAEFEGVTIPMTPQVRSLNLAVSVGIGLFEAKRQLGWQ